MKALVMNGNVVQVAAEEFPVSKSFEWVDTKDATPAPGWTYDGQKFIAPPPVVLPVQKTPEYMTLAEQYAAIWDTMVESTVGYIAQEPNYTLQNIKDEFAEFKAVVAAMAALKATGGSK